MQTETKPNGAPALPSLEQIAANYAHMVIKNTINGVIAEFHGKIAAETMLMIFTSEVGRIMGGVGSDNEAGVLKIRHKLREQFRESINSRDPKNVVQKPVEQKPAANVSATEPPAAA